MIPFKDHLSTYENRVYSKIIIQELPSMRVACYRTVSPTPERDSIRYMKQWIEERDLNFSKQRIFGFAVPISETEQSMGLWGYECWISVPDSIESTSVVKIKNMVADKYAMLRIRDPFTQPLEKIVNGWLMLHDWVSKSPYKQVHNHPNHYLLEEIKEENCTTYVDLYFPLGKLKILHTVRN
jgi:AraC family transcriptional regulator